MADLQLVARADLRLGRDIVRLVRRHRRDLGKLGRARLDELARAGVGGGAHLKEFVALRFDVRAQAVDVCAVVAEQVAFVGGDDLRARGQHVAVGAQLGVDGLKVLDRVAPLAAGDVHQMHEQAAAVDVAQEVVAEAGTVARTLDDARNVRHDERRTLRHVHDAQVGEEGREVVVCDLRVRLRHHGQQRALAHIREADEAHVRQQLQLEQDRVALARQTGLGKARHLPRRRGEVLVAPAAAPAARGHERLARGHVVHDRAAVRVAQQRAARHADVQALAHTAGAALALTVGTVAGHIFALVAKVHERGHVVVHFKDDVAAAPAVAAVRAAGGHIFLAVEGHCAVAAVARAHGDGHFINKWRSHGHSSLSLPGSPAGDRKTGRARCPPRLRLLCDLFVNRDLLAILVLALELHDAVHEGEERVVLTLADVDAGVDLRSALSDEDVAGQNKLTVGSLGAKALRLTVAAVLGGTHAFFMCHFELHLHVSKSVAEIRPRSS